MLRTLLVHGGLWQDIDAEWFWGRTGVLKGLRAAGLRVLAPDRLPRARGWEAEVEHLAGFLSGDTFCVVGASNGCSVAARLAVKHPEAVARLLLAWPATAGDAAVDARERRRLAELGATQEATEALLAGETLRGVRDAELRGLAIPIGVLPAAPENPSHRRRTVEALLRLLRGGVELPACPEPPAPEFPQHLPAFIEAVAAFALAP